MSIKSKVLAATAALTLVGGVGAMSAFSAGAATPSCGHDCLDLFSREFGTHAHPNFVQDALRQGANLGQPVILFRTSNSDPAEDFTVSFQGITSDFFAAGLVSPAVALHYGCATAANGGPFVTCAAGRGRPRVRDRVRALRRGQRPVRGRGQDRLPEREGHPPAVRRLGQDRLDPGPQRYAPALNPPPTLSASIMAGSNGYVPLINGSDTNFSHPFVLTYPKNGFPTDIPRPQLMVQNLTGFSHGRGSPIGSVQDNQLWGADFGVLR